MTVKSFDVSVTGARVFLATSLGATRVRLSLFSALTSRAKMFLASKLSRLFGRELIVLICNVNFRRQKSATTPATEQLHIILPVNLKTRLVLSGCLTVCSHIVYLCLVQFF